MYSCVPHMVNLALEEFEGTGRKETAVRCNVILPLTRCYPKEAPVSEIAVAKDQAKAHDFA